MENYSKIIIGIDEAGRGPLSGPVVAASVYLPSIIIGLADSKKLSKRKREFLYNEILNSSKVGIGIATNEEIDQINILQATLLAMQRSYQSLNIKGDLVLVDGNKAPSLEANEVKAIIDGDNIEPIISAASIIAKVTRDKIMDELNKEFPQYLWDKNSGYATKAHIEAISKYGITKYHRKSFSPVAKYLF